MGRRQRRWVPRRDGGWIDCKESPISEYYGRGSNTAAGGRRSTAGTHTTALEAVHSVCGAQLGFVSAITPSYCRSRHPDSAACTAPCAGRRQLQDCAGALPSLMPPSGFKCSTLQVVCYRQWWCASGKLRLSGENSAENWQPAPPKTGAGTEHSEQICWPADRATKLTNKQTRNGEQGLCRRAAGSRPRDGRQPRRPIILLLRAVCIQYEDLGWRQRRSGGRASAAERLTSHLAEASGVPLRLRGRPLHA